METSQGDDEPCDMVTTTLAPGYSMYIDQVGTAHDGNIHNNDGTLSAVPEAAAQGVSSTVLADKYLELHFVPGDC